MTAVGALLVLALSWDPAGSARAHLGKGIQDMQAERYLEAAAQFEQALRKDPNLVEARRRAAVCYFEVRNYERARELFERMLAARQDFDLTAYYLGRIALTHGEVDSAIRWFLSIRGPEPVRDELYYLGVAYYKKGEYSLAAERLKRAAEQNPRDARCHQFLARAYQKLGRAADAAQQFAETRRLHDYYLEGSVAIAGCRSLLIANQPDQAWESCRPRLETDDVDKIAAIGMLFGGAGQHEKARVAWEKALALDPESPEVTYNLALTCFHLKDIVRARQHAAAAVRLNPDFVEANVLYGTILYMLAEDEEAVAVLKRALELKPDDENVRRLLAHELAITGSKPPADSDGRKK